MDKADFDTSLTDTLNLISSGVSDIYIQKYEVSGNLIWVKQIGDTHEEGGMSIAIGAFGLVYITGYFSATVDFDPGPGIFNMSSVGNHDIFIQKLDSSGNFI